ncbi:MAG: hypothetical protein KDN22_25190 [Verrucomicrobiae bacterium]|nr:hypothetical protein [Verrucomicrobiae bacterium]
MKNFTESAYTYWPLIADHILQATVLLGAILILTRLLKHLSSARKHALLLMGLLGIPLLLLVATVSPSHWKLPGTFGQFAPDSLAAKSDQTLTPIPLRVESTINVEAPVGASSKSVSIAAAALPPSIPEGLTITSPEPRQPAWPALLAVAWVTGIALCLLRLGIGWLSLRFAMRKLHTCESPEIIAQYNEVQRIHPGLPTTRLLQSSNASMPMTFGSLRPSIVMPSDASPDSEKVF